MGEWHKHQGPVPSHPCTNCEAGSCSVATEMRDGELWTKTDDCHETCQLLKDHNARSLAGVLKAGMTI